MKQILRATAVLSGSSMATIAAGLVTAKVNAVALGPAGVGQFGLLLSLLGLASIVAGFGVGTGLVRSGAKAVSGGRDDETDALWSGVWLIYWGLTLPTASALFIFRLPFAAAVGLSPENAIAVAFVAVALLCSVASGLHIALLNAHHRVGILARYGIFAAIVQSSVSVAFVLSLGRAGIPYAIVGSQLAGLVLARTLTLQHVGSRSPTSLRCATSAASGLLRFGGPYTLSMLAGTGTQMLIPLLVVRLFDEAAVGYVGAATAIAVSYMGVLSNAMAQDYYPRLSAIADEPERTVVVVNQQLEAIYMIAGPLIFLALGLSPAIIAVIYSPAFHPAVTVLEWQLVGDVFKFTSWALATVILAKGRSSAFFLTEASGGTLLLGASLVGMKTFGLEGVGIGYAVTYLLYLLVVYAVVRSMAGFRFSRSNIRTLALITTGILASKALLLVTTAPIAYAVPVIIGVALTGRSGIAAKRAWQAGRGGDAG